MTTEEMTNDPQPTALDANLEKIEALSQRLMGVFRNKRHVRPSLAGPSPELYVTAANQYMTEMMANPSKMLEQQIGYWGQMLKHYAETQEQIAKGSLEPPADKFQGDRRFSNPMWDTHPYFNFVKQQFMINSDMTQAMVDGLEGLEPNEKKRLKYFSSQIMDMMSPTNFLATNPDALTRAIETDGQSLVDGLENLVRDLEANDGELLVTLADKSAFEIGRNIATTPGSVVYRNRMFELIQFTPTTDKVHKIPLIIFPPWINKFYILDLKEKNSLIKWIVDQGYTLFVVSWVNPDASYADVGMENYIEEGYLEAIAQVKEITGEKKVNAVGYCIAGTTLSLSLALMNKRKDRSVNSATLFTTLTDFSDQGEFGVFLGDDFLDGIEEEVAENGILDSFFMARTFSFLRANDLIYTPAIKSYMMGEAPPAFDLLYWNGDGTNLPARMAVEYLRGLCQGDQFAQGGMELCGETLKLEDVNTPICAIACETDHIAAAKDSSRGVQKMGAKDKTFILSQSGHIAGIVNPPSKKKYGHYTNKDLTQGFEAWQSAADFTHSSWWPVWEAWLSKRSGAMVAARIPGTKTHPVLTEAPGNYVRNLVTS